MNQRERLIELISKVQYMGGLEEKLAVHLLANGVIVPPCKVGDTVFYVHDVCDENANEYLDISVGDVISFSMQGEGLWMHCRYEKGLIYWHFVTDNFGKKVFTSRAEAEAELERRKQ